MEEEDEKEETEIGFPGDLKKKPKLKGGPVIVPGLDDIEHPEIDAFADDVLDADAVDLEGDVDIDKLAEEEDEADDDYKDIEEW